MIQSTAHTISLTFQELQILDDYGDASILSGLPNSIGKYGCTFFGDKHKCNKAVAGINKAFKIFEEDALANLE